MSLSQTVQAIISVRADTSQAKSEIKSLRGVERDAARARLAELDNTNKGVERQIATLGKITLGLGAIAGAAVVAKKAMDAYLEDTRLESAAAGANIERLSGAVGDLIENDHLLAFAGKSMNGVWKLNQSEMETVLKGARALQKTMGAELEPTIEKLTESIAKGSTRALKEFGIEAKDKQGALKQLGDIAASVGGNFDMAGDDVKRSGVSIANTFDELQGKFGELVIAMAPAISAFAKLIALIPDSINALSRFADHVLGVDTSSGQSMAGNTKKQAADLRRQAADERRDSLALGQMEGQRGNAAQLAAIGEAKAVELEKQAEALEQYAKVESRKAGATAAKEFVDGFSSMLFNGKDKGKAGAGGKAGAKGGYESGAMEAEGFSGYSSLSAKMQAENDALVSQIDSSLLEKDTFKLGDKESIDNDHEGAEKQNALLREQADAKLAIVEADEALLRSVFGTTDGMNEQTIAVEAMAGAFNTLQTAAGDAYDTLISGGDLSIASFKKVIASGLAAMGKDFFVRGLGELAHAGAAFWTGAYPKAAGHAQNAALYFVAAGAAGVAANAMGYGQGGSGARPAAGGARAGNSLGSGSGRGGDVTRNVTVILGGGYDNQSERVRNAMLARSVKRGMAASESTTIRDG